MTMENDMDMLSLVEAARKTSLTTLAKAIRTGRLSTRRKEDGSYETDPAELAQVSSSPAPSGAASAPGKPVKLTVPAVRRTPLHVTDAELRYRISRAEESLIELKSALEDMRSQRDAWQAMAQARIRPARASSTLRWPWLRATG
jgi:hypothetical protein